MLSMFREKSKYTQIPQHTKIPGLHLADSPFKCIQKSTGSIQYQLNMALSLQHRLRQECLHDLIILTIYF